MPSTIKIFLLHSDSRRLRTAEISNWSGKSLASPRTDLAELLARDELAGSGVYLLTGEDPISGAPTAYIGEAESLCDRLPNHRSKDFWSQIVVFVSKDENLTKAHIRYLESQLIERVQLAARFQLVNAQGTNSKLPESDRADMDVFLERITELLPVLGANLLSTVEDSGKRSDNALVCEIKGIVASGRRVPEGFLVLSGSQAVKALRKSAPEVTQKLRAELRSLGQLLDRGDHFEFVQDFLFTSPSAAAAVVHGGSANGLIAWKNRGGKTLKDIEAE